MSGANQVISAPDFGGPVFGTGGNITVELGASIEGGPTGVYAQNFGIGTLSNQGAIFGGRGGFPNSADSVGGVGVLVNLGQTIDLLMNANAATISGGQGKSGASSSAVGNGGVGVSNAGTIKSLSNSGTISGRSGLSGGAGIANSGEIKTLTNSGQILGGAGGSSNGNSSAGGGGKPEF
jgi:fibronectin-binding autotransporter adhesin